MEEKLVDYLNIGYHLYWRISLKKILKIMTSIIILISQQYLKALESPMPIQIKKSVRYLGMSDLGKLMILIILSGSTCVSVLTYGRKLFIANVGDSRAIIAR